MAAKKRITQGDIARELNISQMAVSYALRGSSRVSPELKRKVLETAERLGYRPHRHAQNLRLGRTNLVAALGLPVKDSPHTGPMMEEFCLWSLGQILKKADIDLTLRFSLEHHELYQLPPWDVDAAILLRPASQEDLQDVEAMGLPYVCINGYAGTQGLAIIPDDRQGTRIALDHLVALGHRRIVYAGTEPREPYPHFSEIVRLQTYCEYMKEHDLPILLDPEEPVTDSRKFVESVHLVGATAVLAYHTYLGVELLTAASLLDLKIPRDFSLVTFNDVYPCESVYPRLTRIMVPMVEIGEIAGNYLLEALNHSQRKGDSIVVEEWLVEGGTTGEPTR